MNNLPRAEYPRPDFVRENFTCLNGEWDFVYDDEDLGLSQKWYQNTGDIFNKKIVVPYTYLCELSGINDQDFHDIVWYRRKVLFKREFICTKTQKN